MNSFQSEASKQKKLDELAHNGHHFLQLNKFREAESCFTQMAKLEKEIEYLPGRALSYRASVYLAEGKNDAALRDYDEAVRLDPDEYDFVYLRARAKLTLHRVEAVVELDDIVMTRGRTVPVAWFVRGNIYREAQRYDEAVKSYTTVLELSPNFDEAKTALAETKIKMIMADATSDIDKKIRLLRLATLSLVREKNYDLAILFYNEILALRSNDARALAARGTAHSNLGHIHEAVQDYKKALETAPDNEEAQEGLSKAQLKREPSNKKTPAPSTPSPQNLSPHRVSPNSSPTSSGSTSPKELPAPINFSSKEERIKALFAEAGRVDGTFESYAHAVDCYSEIISLDLNNAEAYYERAYKCMFLKRGAQVFSDLDTAIALQPNQVKFWHRRACIKYAVGSRETVFQELDELVGKYPENPEAWLCRADLRSDNGDYLNAAYDCEEALKLEAGNKKAEEYLAEILSKMGKFDRSIYFTMKDDFERALFYCNANLAENEQGKFFEMIPIFEMRAVLYVCGLNCPEKAIPDLRKIMELDLRWYPESEYPRLYKVKVEAYKKAEKLLEKTKRLKHSDKQFVELVQEALRVVKAHLEINDTYENTLAPAKQNLSSDSKSSLPEADLSSIKFLEVIGKGSYGVVYKAFWKQNLVAIKTAEKDNNNGSIGREFEVLKNLHHNSVIKIFGYHLSGDGTSLLFMEYHEKGCVAQYLYQPQTWNNPISWRLRCAIGIADGLAYLHDKNIIHRDLNPGNVLVRNDWSVLITDFGTACILDPDQKHQLFDHRAGTVRFDAPEVLIPRTSHGKIAYTKAADLFSFSTFIWAFLAQKLPFENLESETIIGHVALDKIQGRERIPEGTSPKMAELINHCWMHNPAARPTAKKMHKDLSAICVKTIREDKNSFPTLRK